jgi:hypothetical protein
MRITKYSGLESANSWFEECVPGYTYLPDGESLFS